MDATERPDIAIYMPSLVAGGVGPMLANVATVWLQQGHSVEYVLNQRAGENAGRIPDGATVRILNVGRSLAALPGLIRYLRNRRPQALLSSMPINNLVVIAAHCLACSRTRLVISEHTTMSAKAQHSANWRFRLVPWLARWAYRRADHVVAVSQGVADDLAATLSLPAAHISTIHNAVFTDELLRRAQQPCPHPWFAAGEPPVVIGIGRLSRAKNFAVLIRAFAKLRQSRPARLIIYGEGEERKQLEALVAERRLQNDVSLPGYVDNPMAALVRSRVFVLSSDWEGFANVLVEALACGVPIVSTDCPSGPSEILSGGRYGTLVPVGDEAAMAEAIERALDEPAPADRLRRRARDFASGPIARRYLEVLLPAEANQASTSPPALQAKKL